MCAARASSRRLPYLLRVMTQMVGIKGYIGVCGETGFGGEGNGYRLMLVYRELGVE